MINWILRGDHVMSDTMLFADATFGNSATPLHAEDHAVPHYLRVHYWWAYIHPEAVRLFAGALPLPEAPSCERC